MKYPFLKKFSKSIGINESKLQAAFEIEKSFNERISAELSPKVRRKLYQEVYSKVHIIYGKNNQSDIKQNISRKKKIAFLFKKEFLNKSILDIGCGDGALLFAIDQSYGHKNLSGIDISPVTPLNHSKNIIFIQNDIINFKLDSKFDVVILDNVYEHISPYDTCTLLDSIISTVKSDGKIIFLVPNRLFGPWDVTRIVDFTHSGKTKAMGTHLNETTYTELIHELKLRGFTSFYSPLPFRKIKYFSFFFRFPSRWISKIECNNFLMKAIHSLKINNKPFLRFEIIIIASKQ